MDKLRRYLGIIWMFIGPVLFIMLLISAIDNVNSDVKGDISNPIPWIIILAIFLPIAIGLTIFGWYALKGDYNKTGGETV